MLKGIGVCWMQIGANAQKQVVLCSVNGTGGGSQKNCGPGFVCAPLSRADLDAQASFNTNSITPTPSLAGAPPHHSQHINPCGNSLCPRASSNLCC